MIEPGFPTLLAHPALAFLLAALAIGVGAVLVLRGGRARTANAARLYWRRLALLSEVLLALGLIGLAIFAGRITLAADQLLLDRQLATAHDNVARQLVEARRAQCVAPPAMAAAPAAAAATRARPAGRHAGTATPATPATSAATATTASDAAPAFANLTPFNPGVAANALCLLVRAPAAASDSPYDTALLEWQLRARALHTFGAGFPGCVDNVFSRNNDCESTLAMAARLAGAIDTLDAAMQAAHRQGLRLAAVQGDGDWGFALLAALLAAAALALRIGRAAAGWLDDSPGENCSNPKAKNNT